MFGKLNNRIPYYIPGPGQYNPEKIKNLDIKVNFGKGQRSG